MTRKELRDYYRRVRQATDDICAPLRMEDYVPQPITDVSPPKWHMGHTTWFYEAIFLGNYVPGYQVFHKDYAFVFNSYYESFGRRVQRDSRGSLSRPTVEEVRDFRRAIDERMLALIEDLPEAKWTEFSELLVLALNHEQQHQELLITDIKYILSTNPLLPTYLEQAARSSGGAPPPSRFLLFAGGIHELGYQGDFFFYDNERPVHKVYLGDFTLQNRLVTNGEYLAFVEEGGYKDFRFWLSDGWETVKKEGWNAPLYWENHDGKWYEFTLGGLKKLDLNLPVCHVSYYEADAFANWSGKRLPTEGEWEVAARQSGVTRETGNFYDSGNFHPLALDGSANPAAMHQMFGDCWEWTRSAYLPYPGYKAVPGPVGEYNGKFMVNQMVMKGAGSCATSKDHARITYRNFFQPDKRWQFKGIRLAE
ncbi:MAG TPA: ergothioneine biosynthesis protein EgtB [Calditrichia bacterium]|nr:ergothioneine biosynthesis protein EgtB [Calditrichota bacterium]HQV33300.1 ergothioneine biosynthesis protein EgtB [Calditrichia bacterium]